MLRKRNRSHQKDQPQQPQMGHLTIPGSGFESCYAQSDSRGNNKKASCLFSVPRVFVGFSPKGLSDCDSVRSPTSPLDVKVFSNLGGPYRSPRSPHMGQPKSWDCGKVGLSIVDSLGNDTKEPGKVLRSSDNKNIPFGMPERSRTSEFQPRTNSFEAAKSLPRNFAIFPHTHIKSLFHKGNTNVIFEIEGNPFETGHFGSILSSSLDSCRPIPTLSRFASRVEKLGSGKFSVDDETGQVKSPGESPRLNHFASKNLISASMSAGSSHGLIGSLSASEIELSEDYTCIISHGPNPKTTHIFGDCILECRLNELSDFGKNGTEADVGIFKAVTSSTVPSAFPSNDFLSFCYYCNKKLEEGKDIYIYGGEKAFCSLGCRSQEIMIDEELEKNTLGEEPPKSKDGEKLFEAGIFDAL